MGGTKVASSVNLTKLVNTMLLAQENTKYLKGINCYKALQWTKFGEYQAKLHVINEELTIFAYL